MCLTSGRFYLLCGLRSLISTLRKGRKAVPQKGQVLFRFESFAVQPAMISSSYTRQSHVLHSEQLDMSTCNKMLRRSDVQRYSVMIVVSHYGDECLIRGFDA